MRDLPMAGRAPGDGSNGAGGGGGSCARRSLLRDWYRSGSRIRIPSQGCRGGAMPECHRRERPGNRPTLGAAPEGRPAMVRRRRGGPRCATVALGALLVAAAADSGQRSPQRPDRREAARAEAVEASLELSWATRRAIQRRLQQDDFDPGPLDGLMGSRTREAVRNWQDAQGMLPTGYLDARQAELLREPSFPLHDAAWAGDVARIRRLLAAGAHVNGLDRDRKTPLHLAAADGHVEAIDALIEAGANVNARDDSEYGDGVTPLHVAVAHDHAGAITALIAAGADVNSEDRPFGVAPLHVALGVRGSYALYVDRTAVNRRHSAAAVVRSLLSAGADPGSREFLDGYTPLQHAASRRAGSGPNIDLPVIRALLAAGADPNDVPLIVGDPGPEDFSPSALHYAAAAGDVAVIQALIAAGADVHMTALGGRYPDYVYRTPLNYAVANGHKAAAEVLSAHEER